MLIIASAAAFILSAFEPGKAALDEKEVVAYAKGIDVGRLDPTLPKQRLEDWISFTIPAAENIVWRTSDCGLKPYGPEPPDGNPLCVEFVFSLGDLGIWGQITVGTDRKGVLGEPRFDGVSVIKEHGRVSRSTHKLSELVRVIAESK